MSMPELRSAGTSEVLVEAGEAPASKKIEGRSPWRLAYERLRTDRAAKIALGTILVIVLLAILAPVFAKIVGHGPNQQFIDIGENANGGPVARTARSGSARTTTDATCSSGSSTAPGSPSSSACSPPGSASPSACCSAWPRATSAGSSTPSSRGSST